MFWADIGREFWLTDQLNSRITQFDIDGNLIGTVNYAVMRSEYQNYSGLGSRRFLAVGTQFQGPDYAESVIRYAIVNQELETTVLIHEYHDMSRYELSEGRLSTQPFHLPDQAVAFPDGRILLSQPLTPRLTVYSNTGEIQYYIERDWEKQQVSGEEKRRIRDRWRSIGQPEVASRIPFPDRKPFFGSPVIDTEGRIWLQRYRSPEDMVDEEGQINWKSQYEIYDQDGIWLGTQSLDHTPKWITADYMYYSYLSEMGPRFERLQILPRIPEMQESRDNIQGEEGKQI